MEGGASAAGERAPPGERASGGACREGAASGPDSPDGTGRRSSVRSCDSGREYAHWPPGYFTFSARWLARTAAAGTSPSPDPPSPRFFPDQKFPIDFFPPPPGRSEPPDRLFVAFASQYLQFVAAGAPSRPSALFFSREMDVSGGFSAPGPQSIGAAPFSRTSPRHGRNLIIHTCSDSAVQSRAPKNRRHLIDPAHVTRFDRRKRDSGRLPAVHIFITNRPKIHRSMTLQAFSIKIAGFTFQGLDCTIELCNHSKFQTPKKNKLRAARPGFFHRTGQKEP
ncbi:hypothetical protein GEV33_009494 [Tenebrio molitor]|uniref:Uncharacterized protein n=1 Tax=Tenebrio molitor TaxID=7067 RepID=A0A8J6H7B0_TENMO|nr:hypothetical protein GEV33_009494 [Tenebrio molitor]